MRGKEKRWYSSCKWFVVLVILAVLIWVVWFVFFSYAFCDTRDCFNSRLEGCNKAKFVGGEEMIFEYTIKGFSNKGCEVRVQLLQGELNNQDSEKLETYEMTCYLPEGVIMIPEKNIGKCTGLLKEGLQDLVIKKLHTYLVQNLDNLNLDTLNVSEVN